MITCFVSLFFFSLLLFFSQIQYTYCALCSYRPHRMLSDNHWNYKKKKRIVVHVIEISSEQKEIFFISVMTFLALYKMNVQEKVCAFMKNVRENRLQNSSNWQQWVRENKRSDVNESKECCHWIESEIVLLLLRNHRNASSFRLKIEKYKILLNTAACNNRQHHLHHMLTDLSAGTDYGEKFQSNTEW